MTFQQLQHLLAVHRTGSFSLAAKEMFVSQSAVSNAISGLEQELGCRIFVRSAHGLSLTPEGTRIVDLANGICERQTLLAQTGNSQQNQVRIASLDYRPASQAFARLMKENQDRPELSFSLVNASAGNFNDMIQRCQLDLAVNLSFSAYDQAIDENIRRNNLASEKLAVQQAAIYIGPGHRLYGKEGLTPKDFNDDRLLEIPGKFICRAGVLDAHLHINPDRAVVASGTIVRRALLQEGVVYGIGWIPSKQERENSDLQYIPIPGLSYTVRVVYDPLRPLSPELKRYLELLKEEIRIADL